MRIAPTGRSEQGAGVLRILHILDHSLPMHSGYAFRTRAIMKAQLAQGWEVAGLTGGRHTAPGPDEELVEGLRFFRAPGGGAGGGALGELAYVQTLAGALRGRIDAFKPDLIHAHSPCLNGLAALWAKRGTGIPLLYEIRAFWEDAAVGNGTGREGSFKYRLTRLLESRVCHRAEAVAVICDGLRGDLIARGIAAEKIMVSHNGVDLDMFGDPPPRDAALATELGFAADDEVVGFIGSFYDYEGLDDLIAAMPALRAERPKAKLLIVGGGPMEEALKGRATSSPASSSITFAGRVPHNAVERYYSLIDVLAYPRKKMRLTDLVTPLKPLEAMAQGKMVAASDVGGHRELIEDDVTGTLFAPGDPAAIATTLAALFADRANWAERRETARAYVERDRNWSSNIQRYAPIYAKLTGSADTI
jgi:PEP-CTERM/exosortase A-associated glycosyltransferase